MTKEQQIAKIKEGFTPPFRYEDLAYCILDAKNGHVLDIRGWGKLHKAIGPEEANSVQNAMGQLITDLLNERIEP